MKTTSKLLVIGTAFTLVTAASAERAVAASIVNSASGGAQQELSNGDMRTFAFGAVLYSDGTATGQAELHNPATNADVHVAVDCLRVVGNEATVSGIIAQSNSPILPVGGTAIFGAVDNGEGTNSRPDLITLLAPLPFPFSPGVTSCADAPSPLPLIFLTPVDHGNVQVR